MEKRTNKLNEKENIQKYLIKRKFEDTNNELSKKKREDDNLSNFPLIKIISGGQTGADMGALEAAEALGIETGGTATQDFWTTEGKCPELGTRFHLKELTVEKKSQFSISAMYIKRSMLNVDNSDGTIAFRLYSSSGTDKTIGYCLTKKWQIVTNFKTFGKTKYKPLLVIEDLSDQKKDFNVQKIRSFIFDNNIKILNVCGHREDVKTGFKSFKITVKNILVSAFLIEIENFYE